MSQGDGERTPQAAGPCCSSTAALLTHIYNTDHRGDCTHTLSLGKALCLCGPLALFSIRHWVRDAFRSRGGGGGLGGMSDFSISPFLFGGGRIQGCRWLIHPQTCYIVLRSGVDGRGVCFRSTRFISLSFSCLPPFSCLFVSLYPTLFLSHSLGFSLSYCSLLPLSGFHLCTHTCTHTIPSSSLRLC